MLVVEFINRDLDINQQTFKYIMMKKFNNLFKLMLGVFFALPIFLFNSCDNDDQFIDVVPDIAKAIIRDFQVAGKSASINHNTGVVTSTLPAGTNLSSVAVTMSLPDGTTVDPAAGTFDFSNGPLVFTTTSSEGATREYTATISAYGDPKILSFSIAGKSASINDSEGTIEIQIGSQDGNLSSLVPNFVIAEGTSVDVASGVSRNFVGPVKYTVLSNDGYTAKEYTVNVSQIASPSISSFKIGESIGAIDQENGLINLTMPAFTDVTNLSPIISTPEEQTVSPASGVAQDFSSDVTYTVTNSENLSKDYIVSVDVQTVTPTKYAFIGEQESISELLDDDAKAAATWMESTYGENFTYLKISDVSNQTLGEIKVAMIYYLSPAQDLGYFATPENPFTLLPTELYPGSTQSIALKNWVKSGGDLLLGGDATPVIFSIERVPADFSAPRGPGNYVYSEYGCAGTTGCVDTGKPADDIWGLGVRDTNNSGNRREHPVFKDLAFQGDGELYLQNSATREVRLIWAQHYDGILNPSCCGSEAAQLFEETLQATKFGTLRWIGDAFGYGAVMYNATSGENHSNFDINVGADFQGTVFSLENTLIGYEWDSNGTVNDYQSNIETLTKNILDYLYSLD